MVVAFVIAANESMTISYSLLCRRFVASFVAVVVVDIIIVGVFCFSISSWRLLLLRLACSTFTELVTHSLTHARGTGTGHGAGTQGGSVEAVVLAVVSLIRVAENGLTGNSCCADEDGEELCQAVLLLLLLLLLCSWHSFL